MSTRLPIWISHVRCITPGLSGCKGIEVSIGPPAIIVIYVRRSECPPLKIDDAKEGSLEEAELPSRPFPLGSPCRVVRLLKTCSMKRRIEGTEAAMMMTAGSAKVQMTRGTELSVSVSKAHELIWLGNLHVMSKLKSSQSISPILIAAVMADLEGSSQFGTVDSHRHRHV